MVGHQLHEFVLRRGPLRRAVGHHSRDGSQIRRQTHRRLIDEALFERRDAGASALSRGRAGLSRLARSASGRAAVVEETLAVRGIADVLGQQRIKLVDVAGPLGGPPYHDPRHRPDIVRKLALDRAQHGVIPGGDRRLGFHSHPRHIEDRKSTRLNSSHVEISYAVFCLKKKKSARNTMGPFNQSVARRHILATMHSARGGRRTVTPSMHPFVSFWAYRRNEITLTIVVDG